MRPTPWLHSSHIALGTAMVLLTACGGGGGGGGSHGDPTPVTPTPITPTPEPPPPAVVLPRIAIDTTAVEVTTATGNRVMIQANGATVEQAAVNGDGTIIMAPLAGIGEDGSLIEVLIETAAPGATPVINGFTLSVQPRQVPAL